MEENEKSPEARVAELKRIIGEHSRYMCDHILGAIHDHLELVNIDGVVQTNVVVNALVRSLLITIEVCDGMTAQKIELLNQTITQHLREIAREKEKGGEK